MKLYGVLVAMLVGSVALVGCKSKEEPAPASQECPSTQPAETAAAPAPAPEPTAADTAAQNDDQQPPPKKKKRGRGRRGHRGMGG